MAHQIEGNKAFFTGEPAWHGLGTVLSEAPSIEAAWQLAYPHTLIECAVDAVIGTGEGKLSMPFTGWKAIVRDDGAQIGMVRDSYKLEQPYEILDFFRPFLESGEVSLEAGGSLRDGTCMWALGKINKSSAEIVRGDLLQDYLLAATAFDGTKKRMVKLVKTRVVCANTEAIAMREKTAEWTIKHTTNMDQRVVDVQTVLKECFEMSRQTNEAYRALAKKRMSEHAMHAYVREVLAPGIEEEKYTAPMVTKVNTVIDLLTTQPGLYEVPAIEGTAWQAYNAVSAYVTHGMARNKDNRVHNQWFDKDTIGLNNRALDLALAM